MRWHPPLPYYRCIGGRLRLPGTPSSSTSSSVSVVTAQAEAVPITTELPGRVTACRTAFMSDPSGNGIISKRLFAEGGDVKAGQQLYQIDPAPYQATYDSAVAAEASSRSLAERYKPLVEANAVSKQDYDNAIKGAFHRRRRAAGDGAHQSGLYQGALVSDHRPSYRPLFDHGRRSSDGQSGHAPRDGPAARPDATSTSPSHSTPLCCASGARPRRVC